MEKYINLGKFKYAQIVILFILASCNSTNLNRNVTSYDVNYAFDYYYSKCNSDYEQDQFITAWNDGDFDDEQLDERFESYDEFEIIVDSNNNTIGDNGTFLVLQRIYNGLKNKEDELKTKDENSKHILIKNIVNEIYGQINSTKGPDVGNAICDDTNLNSPSNITKSEEGNPDSFNNDEYDTDYLSNGNSTCDEEDIFNVFDEGKSGNISDHEDISINTEGDYTDNPDHYNTNDVKKNDYIPGNDNVLTYPAGNNTSNPDHYNTNDVKKNDYIPGSNDYEDILIYPEGNSTINPDEQEIYEAINKAVKLVFKNKEFKIDQNTKKSDYIALAQDAALLYNDELEFDLDFIIDDIQDDLEILGELKNSKNSHNYNAIIDPKPFIVSLLPHLQKYNNTIQSTMPLSSDHSNDEIKDNNIESSKSTPFYESDSDDSDSGDEEVEQEIKDKEIDHENKQVKQKIKDKEIDHEDEEKQDEIKNFRFNINDPNKNNDEYANYFIFGRKWDNDILKHINETRQKLNDEIENDKEIQIINKEESSNKVLTNIRNQIEAYDKAFEKGGTLSNGDKIIYKKLKREETAVLNKHQYKKRKNSRKKIIKESIRTNNIQKLNDEIENDKEIKNINTQISNNEILTNNIRNQIEAYDKVFEKGGTLSNDDKNIYKKLKRKKETICNEDETSKIERDKIIKKIILDNKNILANEQLKDEVLNNKFAPITDKTWNGVLKKCSKILKGEFSSKRKNRWSKSLRDNNIGMKELVALKLYTDFDLLSREFRKSFRNPSPERCCEFSHWMDAFHQTFHKFSQIKSALHQPQTLFYGINTIVTLDQTKGIFHGLINVTTDLHVARSFAGKNGCILVLKPKPSKYKVLDISWISDYPDEREYILLDHNVEVIDIILSSDYDQYYHFYHDTLMKSKKLKSPIAMLSNQTRRKVWQEYLPLLKELIKNHIQKDSKEKPGNNNSEIANLTGNDEEKINNFLEILYQIGRREKPTKSNITVLKSVQNCTKDINQVQLPKKFYEKYKNKRQKIRKERFKEEEFSKKFTETMKKIFNVKEINFV